MTALKIFASNSAAKRINRMKSSSLIGNMKMFWMMKNLIKRMNLKETKKMIWIKGFVCKDRNGIIMSRRNPRKK